MLLMINSTSNWSSLEPQVRSIANNVRPDRQSEYCEYTFCLSISLLFCWRQTLLQAVYLYFLYHDGDNLILYVYICVCAHKWILIYVCMQQLSFPEIIWQIQVTFCFSTLGTDRATGCIIYFGRDLSTQRNIFLL